MKKLALEISDITNEWLQSQIFRFVGLESLILENIDTLTTIKISSQKLIKLVIRDCINLDEETMIDAPNLLEVEYSDNKLPFYSLGVSSLLKANFNFYLGLSNDKTIWFNKLKELFTKIHHMKDVKMAILSRDDKVCIHNAYRVSTVRIFSSSFFLLS